MKLNGRKQKTLGKINMHHMAQGLSERNAHRNARLVPVEPDVKSAKTCDLFNAGVRRKSETGKSADPTCYHSPVGAKSIDPGAETPGLFETVNQEN